MIMVRVTVIRRDAADTPIRAELLHSGTEVGCCWSEESKIVMKNFIIHFSSKSQHG